MRMRRVPGEEGKGVGRRKKGCPEHVVVGPLIFSKIPKSQEYKPKRNKEEGGEGTYVSPGALLTTLSNGRCLKKRRDCERRDRYAMAKQGSEDIRRKE